MQIIQRNQLRGAEIFACQLGTELEKMGHRVEMAVLFGEDTGLLEYPLTFHYLRAGEQKGWRDVKGYRQLNELISKGNYDLVQANAGDTLRYAAISKMFYGWKSKLVFRNANKISDFINDPVKKWMYRRLMKKTDAVASVSRECRNDFISLFPFFADKVYELPIGVYVDPSLRKIQRVNDGKQGAPVFLHAGSFVAEKNHAGLIRIFAELLKKYPGAKLWLAGSGPREAEIRQLVTETGLSHAVEFLGARKDLAQLMSCADVFLLPSLIEGLPAVILESFSARLPVVAYDTGGISEAVIDKQTGRLVKKNDEAGFVTAVTELLESGRDQISENAFRLVNKKYSNQKIAAGFSSAYQKIIL